jgi:hypothetical protein
MHPIPPDLPLAGEAFSLARHNGLITVANPRTQGRQTFLLMTALGGRFIGERLVKVLIGPTPDVNHWHAWQTIGVVEERMIALWSRWNTRTYQGYARLLQEPATYRRRGYLYTVEFHCRRCNEPLQDARSLARGLDGICQAYVPEEE